MRAIGLKSLNDFAEWRGIARGLLLAGTAPDELAWHEPHEGLDLFEVPADPALQLTARAVGTVPRRFVELGSLAICHRDPERFALLYRLLWRLQHDHALMGYRDDPDVGKLDRRVAAVRQDAQRLLADIRFGEPDADGRRRARFEPAHYVLERSAPAFMQRFAGQPWEVVTPYRSAVSDGRTLRFGPGGGAATGERRNPPPGEIIAPLMRLDEAEEQMRAGQKVASRPARPAADEAAAFTSLSAVRDAAAECRRCPLFELATQTVFGEGPQSAEIMFVGEQPGDQEDLAGKPFVGPAGQVLDAALAVAGIDRKSVFVTNAVKHFKFEPRGKRRIHQKPNAGEIQACRFWIGLEREFVRPRLIVAMGATAVASLLGKGASIASLRGRPIELDDGTPMWVTVHPSYLLRMPDRSAAEAERRRFEDDLKAIRAFVATLPARRAA